MSRQTLRAASLLMVSAALVGKAVGFLREVVVARAFGAGAEYDAFLAAITIPAAICTVMDYALPNLLVPLYSHSPARQRVLPARFAVGSLFIAGLVALCVTLFAGTIVPLVTPGLSSVSALRAVGILRAYAAMILLGVLYSAGSARLQGRRLFVRPALGPVSLNIVILSSVLLWADRIGAYAIVWSALAATVVLAAWYWWPFKQPPLLSSPPLGPAMSPAPLGRLALGIIGAAVVGQLFFIVDRWWASFLLPGSISALAYGIVIANIPVVVLGTGLGVAIYPFLHDALSAEDPAQARMIQDRAIRYVIWAGVPLAVMIGLYARPLVGLLLERGRFSPDATAVTARLLPFLALGIIPYAATAIWEKVYYAQRRIWRLVAVMCAVFLCKLVLSRLLVGPLGIEGLALATGLSYVGWGMLMYGGIPRIHRPAAVSLVTYFLKICLLTLVGGVVGHFVLCFAVPGPVGDLPGVRLACLALGAVLVWGPLLLVDGRWGIRERRQILDTLRGAWERQRQGE